MAFQPAPDIAQLVLEGTVDQQQTINDIYFKITAGGITPTNLGDLVAAGAGWFSTQLAPLLSENWSTVRVIGTDLGSPIGSRVEGSVTFPGGVSGEAVPNNVAACISLRTAQRGRSGHGRNYVPAIPNSLVTLNTIDPDLIGNLVSAYNLMVGPDSFLPGWQMVVLSRFTGGAPRANGVGIPILTASMVGNSVRSMRSREIGHGS